MPLAELEPPPWQQVCGSPVHLEKWLGHQEEQSPAIFLADGRTSCLPCAVHRAWRVWVYPSWRNCGKRLAEISSVRWEERGLCRAGWLAAMGASTCEDDAGGVIANSQHYRRPVITACESGRGMLYSFKWSRKGVNTMLTIDQKEQCAATNAFEAALKGGDYPQVSYNAPGEWIGHQGSPGQPVRHAWIRGRIGAFTVTFDATADYCRFCGGTR